MTNLYILSVITRKPLKQRQMEVYLCEKCAEGCTVGKIHDSKVTFSEGETVVWLVKPEPLKQFMMLPHDLECEECDGTHRFSEPSTEESVEAKCGEIVAIFEEEMKLGRFQSAGKIQLLIQEASTKMASFVTKIRRGELSR